MTEEACERCGWVDDLVSCFGPDWELLARICDECVREYIESGLDDL